MQKWSMNERSKESGKFASPNNARGKIKKELRFVEEENSERELQNHNGSKSNSKNPKPVRMKSKPLPVSKKTIEREVFSENSTELEKYVRINDNLAESYKNMNTFLKSNLSGKKERVSSRSMSPYKSKHQKSGYHKKSVDDDSSIKNQSKKALTDGKDIISIADQAGNQGGFQGIGATVGLVASRKIANTGLDQALYYDKKNKMIDQFERAQDDDNNVNANDNQGMSRKKNKSRYAFNLDTHNDVKQEQKVKDFRNNFRRMVDFPEHSKIDRLTEKLQAENLKEKMALKTDIQKSKKKKKAAKLWENIKSNASNINKAKNTPTRTRDLIKEKQQAVIEKLQNINLHEYWKELEDAEDEIAFDGRSMKHITNREIKIIKKNDKTFEEELNKNVKNSLYGLKRSVLGDLDQKKPLAFRDFFFKPNSIHRKKRKHSQGSASSKKDNDSKISGSSKDEYFENEAANLNNDSFNPKFQFAGSDKKGVRFSPYDKKSMASNAAYSINEKSPQSILKKTPVKKQSESFYNYPDDSTGKKDFDDSEAYGEIDDAADFKDRISSSQNYTKILKFKEVLRNFFLCQKFYTIGMSMACLETQSRLGMSKGWYYQFDSRSLDLRPCSQQDNTVDNTTNEDTNEVNEYDRMPNYPKNSHGHPIADTDLVQNVNAFTVGMRTSEDIPDDYNDNDYFNDDNNGDDDEYLNDNFHHEDNGFQSSGKRKLTFVDDNRLFEEGDNEDEDVGDDDDFLPNFSRTSSPDRNSRTNSGRGLQRNNRIQRNFNNESFQEDNYEYQIHDFNKHFGNDNHKNNNLVNATMYETFDNIENSLKKRIKTYIGLFSNKKESKEKKKENGKSSVLVEITYLLEILYEKLTRDSSPDLRKIRVDRLMEDIEALCKECLEDFFNDKRRENAESLKNLIRSIETQITRSRITIWSHRTQGIQMITVEKGYAKFLSSKAYEWLQKLDVHTMNSANQSISSFNLNSKRDITNDSFKDQQENFEFSLNGNNKTQEHGRKYHLLNQKENGRNFENIANQTDGGGKQVKGFQNQNGNPKGNQKSSKNGKMNLGSPSFQTTIQTSQKKKGILKSNSIEENRFNKKQSRDCDHKGQEISQNKKRIIPSPNNIKMRQLMDPSIIRASGKIKNTVYYNLEQNLLERKSVSSRENSSVSASSADRFQACHHSNIMKIKKNARMLESSEIEFNSNVKLMKLFTTNILGICFENENHLYLVEANTFEEIKIIDTESSITVLESWKLKMISDTYQNSDMNLMMSNKYHMVQDRYGQNYNYQNELHNPNDMETIFSEKSDIYQKHMLIAEENGNLSWYNLFDFSMEFTLSAHTDTIISAFELNFGGALITFDTHSTLRVWNVTATKKVNLSQSFFLNTLLDSFQGGSKRKNQNRESLGIILRKLGDFRFAVFYMNSIYLFKVVELIIENHTLEWEAIFQGVSQSVPRPQGFDREHSRMDYSNVSDTPYQLLIPYDGKHSLVIYDTEWFYDYEFEKKQLRFLHKAKVSSRMVLAKTGVGKDFSFYRFLIYTNSKLAQVQRSDAEKVSEDLDVYSLEFFRNDSDKRIVSAIVENTESYWKDPQVVYGEDNHENSRKMLSFFFNNNKIRVKHLMLI